ELQYMLSAPCASAGAIGAATSMRTKSQRWAMRVAPVAEGSRHQAHRLQLRQVRRVGRAQAPARALGSRHRSADQIACANVPAPRARNYAKAKPRVDPERPPQGVWGRTL